MRSGNVSLQEKCPDWQHHHRTQTVTRPHLAITRERSLLMIFLYDNCRLWSFIKKGSDNARLSLWRSGSRPSQPLHRPGNGTRLSLYRWHVLLALRQQNKTIYSSLAPPGLKTNKTSLSSSSQGLPPPVSARPSNKNRIDPPEWTGPLSEIDEFLMQIFIKETLFTFKTEGFTKWQQRFSFSKLWCSSSPQDCTTQIRNICEALSLYNMQLNLKKKMISLSLSR